MEELALDRTTVRRILLAAGVTSPRPRRAPRHRSRRERLPQEGMLLQADGSRHDWLEGRGPWLTLVGAIDDATGTVPWAVFRDQEDAHGYLLLLREIVRTKGIPWALYVDRHGIFKKSTHAPLRLEEELAGWPAADPGRPGASRSSAIEHISALSPQAKGRIERLWGTFQDRLVAELRLAGATTLPAANQVLGPFLRPSTPASPSRRPTPRGLPAAPARRRPRAHLLLQVRARRAGRQHHPLRWPPAPTPARRRPRQLARARVEVHERLDGSLAVVYRGTALLTTLAPPDAPTLRARAHPRPGAGLPQAPAPLPTPPITPLTSPDPPPPPVPKPDHPWRRLGGVKVSPTSG